MWPPLSKSKRSMETKWEKFPSIFTLGQQTRPSEIMGHFYNVKVSLYVPIPLRCFKFLEFGHIWNRCRGEAHCNCGLPTHEGTECLSPFVWVKCKGNLSSRFPKCPDFIAEMEIQQLKTEKQLPYHEAKKIVRSKSYVTKIISFAEITARPQH